MKALPVHAAPGGIRRGRRWRWLRRLAIPAALAAVLLAWLILHPPQRGFHWSGRHVRLDLSLADGWSSVPRLGSIGYIMFSGDGSTIHRGSSLHFGNLLVQWTREIENPTAGEFQLISQPLDRIAVPAAP